MMAWTGEYPEAFVRIIGLIDLAGGLGMLLPSLTRIMPRLTVIAAMAATVTSDPCDRFSLLARRRSADPAQLRPAGTDHFHPLGSLEESADRAALIVSPRIFSNTEANAGLGANLCRHDSKKLELRANSREHWPQRKNSAGALTSQLRVAKGRRQGGSSTQARRVTTSRVAHGRPDELLQGGLMRTHHLGRYVSICAAALGLGGFSAVAGAQSTAPNQLEEITVTAERVETSLQKTPISVTAFGAEELRERGLTNLLEMSTFTPNLVVGSRPGGGFARGGFAIRGIGVDGGADAAVGVYVDDVYYPSGTEQHSRHV